VTNHRRLQLGVDIKEPLRFKSIWTARQGSEVRLQVPGGTTSIRIGQLNRLYPPIVPRFWRLVQVITGAGVQSKRSCKQPLMARSFTSQNCGDIASNFGTRALSCTLSSTCAVMNTAPFTVLVYSSMYNVLQHHSVSIHPPLPPPTP